MLAVVAACLMLAVVAESHPETLMIVCVDHCDVHIVLAMQLHALYNSWCAVPIPLPCAALYKATHKQLKAGS